ncbi:MAG TPA: ribosome maturation factor RimP [Thermoleophilaceae bacterium]|nr:ribosome maturation factor RimP [Thermoleophilaceae bacterium]
MEPIRQVEDLIAPSLRDMGYELVRVMLRGRERPTLEIMAERADRAPMTVEDCAEISRAVSALLDVEDPLPGSYVLEVTSPGIDRPLVRPDDFARFAGFEARIETATPIDGRRRFKGRLIGVEGDEVRIDVDGTVVPVPLASVKKAKLVLTDELIAASGGGSGGSGRAESR